MCRGLQLSQEWGADANCFVSGQAVEKLFLAFWTFFFLFFFFFQLLFAFFAVPSCPTSSFMITFNIKYVILRDIQYCYVQYSKIQWQNLAFTICDKPQPKHILCKVVKRLKINDLKWNTRHHFYHLPKTITETTDSGNKDLSAAHSKTYTTHRGDENSSNSKDITKTMRKKLLKQSK